MAALFWIIKLFEGLSIFLRGRLEGLPLFYTDPCVAWHFLGCQWQETEFSLRFGTGERRNGNFKLWTFDKFMLLDVHDIMFFTERVDFMRLTLSRAASAEGKKSEMAVFDAKQPFFDAMTLLYPEIFGLEARRKVLKRWKDNVIRAEIPHFATRDNVTEVRKAYIAKTA